MNNSCDNNSPLKMKDNRDERKLCVFLSAYYFIQALNLIVKIAFNVPDSLWNLVSYSLMSVLVIIMFFTITPVIKRGFIVIFLSAVVWILMYILSYLMGNAPTNLLIDKGFTTIFICVPLAVYMYCIRDRALLLRYLTKISIILAFCLSLLLIFAVGNDEKRVYSMSASYALVMPAAILFSDYFSSKKKSSMIFAILSLICIALFGAKGPMLCVVYFLIAYNLSHYKIDLKRIGIIISLCCLALVMVIWWDKISAVLIGIMGRLGINSRTLKFLINNNLSDILTLSHRQYLFEYYLDLIRQKPVIGWGVCGGWISSGYYPHNVFIEYLLSFGIFIGLILCIFSVKVLFSPLFKEKKSYMTDSDRNLLLIYSASCMGLLVSGTFLDSVNWFVLVGLYLAIVKNKSKKIGSENHEKQ